METPAVYIFIDGKEKYPRNCGSKHVAQGIETDI